MIVHANDLADDARISREAMPPAAITDHRNLLIIARKYAPKYRTDTQRGKVVSRDRVDASWIPDAIRLDVAHPSTEPTEHVRKRGCMLLDLVEHRKRQLPALLTMIRIERRDLHQPLRIMHRQRAQKQRIDQAENRRIGANPER